MRPVSLLTTTPYKFFYLLTYLKITSHRRNKILNAYKRYASELEQCHMKLNQNVPFLGGLEFTQ